MRHRALSNMFDSSCTECRIAVLLLALCACVSADNDSSLPERAALNAEIRNSSQVWFWREPIDIAQRDLCYGAGGLEHAPKGTLRFVEEDRNGTTPKFIVVDGDGVKWTAKLGPEARPETVASRLVWVAGYFVNEDYFLPKIRIMNMPSHLHRGQRYVDPGGTVHDVRFKRQVMNAKKLGNWDWEAGPFAGTRELDGLRTLMALVNNWDLKLVNNSIYEQRQQDGSLVHIYMVTDLGASFGSTGIERTETASKGNLNRFEHSTFLKNVTPTTVDFATPDRATLFELVNPPAFARRLSLEDIGRNVPRAHAKWMGELLSHLSPEQIRDAFRAAAYTPQQVEVFARILEARITELRQL